LVFRSRIAPKEVFSSQAAGFSLVRHGDIPWRIYSLRSKSSDRWIQVGERLDERKHISTEVIESVLKPIAWVLPLLGALLLFSLGRALRPLSRLSQAIAERDVNNLNPMNTESVFGELRPIIEQLNHLFERIKASLENEKRFTADAAHELRTPVAGIRLQVQVAQHCQDEEERQHALSKAIQGCDRATRVTEQLLVLARLDNSEAVSLSDPVNCTELAKELLGDLSTMAHDKAISLSLEAGKIRIIKSNEMLLRILLRNLVDNAIRYSPPRTEVVIRLGIITDQTVWLEVTDQGPGIKSEDRQRIMERFYRGDQTQPGSGLGLSIAQRIATLLGGQLFLLDGNPTGLTVRVEVPV
jgi:two-component system sensor histidine kinase QseC